MNLLSGIKNTIRFYDKNLEITKRKLREKLCYKKKLQIIFLNYKYQI